MSKMIKRIALVLLAVVVLALASFVSEWIG